MARKSATFRQSDLTRAAKGMLAAGLAVSRTEIMPDGRIVIFHGAEVTSAPDTPFDEWKAKRDAR